MRSGRISAAASHAPPAEASACSEAAAVACERNRTTAETAETGMVDRAEMASESAWPPAKPTLPESAKPT